MDVVLTVIAAGLLKTQINLMVHGEVVNVYVFIYGPLVISILLILMAVLKTIRKEDWPDIGLMIKGQIIYEVRVVHEKGLQKA